MTNYSLPTGSTPNAAAWGRIINQRRFTAESGIAKFQGRGGSRHSLTLQWFNVTGTRRQNLDGFLYKLNGGAHRAQIGPASLGYKRRGSGGGLAPLLNAAHTAGAQFLSADGATINVTNWLRAGDWVNLNNDLYKVVADTNSNGSGVVVVDIWPPLVKNYADNTALVIDAAAVYGIFFETAPAAMPASPFNATDFIADNITLSLEQDPLA